MTQAKFTLDVTRVPSPCYVVDKAKLEQNLRILDYVQQQSGAKVLLALKAFSMFSLAPLVMKYLNGVCASGLNEAKLTAKNLAKKCIHTPQHFARRNLKKFWR